MVPAQLLNELGDELGVRDELLLLVRVPQELDHAQVYHVDHGRVPGDEKQEGKLYGVRLLNYARVDLLRRQLADEVILGLGAAFVDQFAEVAEKFPASC